MPLMIKTPLTDLTASQLDLGLPKGARIVVAMSGGVDSSVTAALVHRAGYDVVGITLQLYDHGVAIAKKGACCAGQDIADARAVADRLGIPHYVLDYEDRFGDSVMQDFADTYLAGATPIPCVRCNQRVKFRDLLHTARDLGAAAMATGHYIRRTDDDRGLALRRAEDAGKDQSYFLFATTREQLSFLRFPLGDLPKETTRQIAAELGLGVADKPDSQDICFVPEGRYASVVERLRPGAATPGAIVDLNGQVLGQHQGIIHYTVGQRRGLALGGLVEPLYVIRLDADRAEVVVGPKAALGVRAIRLDEMNWLGTEEAATHRVAVKVRSTKPPVLAVLKRSGAEAEVMFDEPQEGVAPGQAGVFYALKDDQVLGGGWIRSTVPVDVSVVTDIREEGAPNEEGRLLHRTRPF
ncbi:tRNA (5-methylaminomethyl-2-thiouridylate)-methyltransferase [Parvularcula bermudensis HTCC2503]|uniref:tRNA-specific 2-thiouridylase MnmA n=1 Tax=Parvularcula bermudensis (strain ATCC BAA-594 / HTCC2503 / KCTC 12087) TaxID=314260 RepID=E0TG01_PARBH|nr:tRNA (5-methylaminomethyl-2-thiouridylate)-methyltransferase [Parvularcula bermudensis HTCC2503]